MKLLIVTQKVDINDDILGFFHDWIKKFAKNCEKVIVICLEKGAYDLPENVRVFSLGKEENNFYFFKKIKYLFKFYVLIWKYRNDYDKVFVHMIPMYVNIGAPIWKIFKKRIGLWYAHGYISFSLRLAEKLADDIFTASQKSFRLFSKKLKILGHGINLEKFKPIKKNEFDTFQMISVGRISPIKKYQELITAIKILKNKDNRTKINLNIIGAPIDEKDKKYFKELREKVRELNLNNNIKFIGSIPYKKINEYLSKADLFLHASQTGSLDKVVLEAMAMGLIVVSSNEASKDLFSSYGDRFVYESGNQDNLTNKIEAILKINNNDKLKLQTEMREIVKSKHSLNILIKNIIDILNGKANK